MLPPALTLNFEASSSEGPSLTTMWSPLKRFYNHPDLSFIAFSSIIVICMIYFYLVTLFNFLLTTFADDQKKAHLFALICVLMS